MPDITSLSVLSLLREQRHGLSTEDIFNAYRHKALNDKNNAFITVLDRADNKHARPDSPLAGIPYAAKDNICTKGIPTTCASAMLKNHTPIFDATVITKLNTAGAVLLGKTNMDEFAMGSTSQTGVFGAVLNPLNPEFTAGGSSGGSAAAVAACQAAFALGSDTGGSIRLPASYCSVVGMKPTYGRVSRNGLIAFASSFDQIGPITRTVRDNALVLSCICGIDPMDSTSADRPCDVANDIGKDIKNIRFAIIKEFDAYLTHPEIKKSFDKAINAIESLGGKVHTVSLNSLNEALWAYYIISSAEASSNLARYDGIRYGHSAQNAQSLEELYRKSRSQGFSSEVKRRILLGTHVLSAGYKDAHYNKALNIRAALKAHLDSIFCEHDAIIAPVSPLPAQKLGQQNDNVTDIFYNDIFNVIANVAGLPAISIPCAFDDNGIGIGVQLMGGQFNEKLLYRCAYALEQSFGIAPTEAENGF